MGFGLEFEFEFGFRFGFKLNEKREKYNKIIYYTYVINEYNL